MTISYSPEVEAILSEPTATVDELARVLSCGRNQAYDLVRSGQVRSIESGVLSRFPPPPSGSCSKVTPRRRRVTARQLPSDHPGRTRSQAGRAPPYPSQRASSARNLLEGEPQ